MVSSTERRPSSALTQGLQFSEYQRALRERQMQEPIFRRQVQQGLLTGGLGPTGQTTQQIQHGNLAGDIAGLGLMGLGLATGGPAGAAAASQVGGGSSFQPGGLFSGFDPRVYNRARMGVGG